MLPTRCPSCQALLQVERLRCPDCGTGVEGRYPLPPLAALSREDQSFIEMFVKVSGSLKEMARQMKVSYPTVRNRLDEVIDHLAAQKEDDDGR